MPSLRPYPAERVRDEGYLDDLESRVTTDTFPDPDADLIPRLTTARFVAEAAREAGEGEFAANVERVREPVFEPLNRFEVVAALSDGNHPEDADNEEFTRLVKEMGLSGVEPPEDDPERLFTDHLSARELTFFDYPAPPLHVIESAESWDSVDVEETRERFESIPEEYRTYGEQRFRIEDIVRGARGIATDVYNEVIEEVQERSVAGVQYDDADEYAEVVAFNAALAAEAMLESTGELVTAP
jgi:hypothetical protein